MKKQFILIIALSMTLMVGCAFSDKAAPSLNGDGDSPAVEDGDLEVGDNEAAEISLIKVVPPGNWNPNASRTPTAIHLTYQQDTANHMTLQWQTEEKEEGGYVPKVWLARAIDIENADPTQYEVEVDMPFAEILTAEGSAEWYCTKFLCGDELDALQWQVEIALPDPNAVYYYRVGTWESFNTETGEFTGADLSPVYHFRSGNTKGSREPFVFGFGSDSQNWKDEITDRMKEIRSNTGAEVRFWLFGGDLTEMGSQKELWGWFDVLAPMLHYFPFMPVQGNHDIIVSALLGEFALPQMSELSDDTKEIAWSFNNGNAHFVGINSNGESLIEDQLAFLDADLKAASEDPDIDWKVMIFHHPMYSSASAHGSTDYLQRQVAPLIDKYGVDLAFSGHDHDYERTKPMRAGQIIDSGEGTVYIVSGGFYSKKNYGNGTSDFTAKSVDGETKSYVVVSVEGKTLNGTAYAGNHDVLDTFTLTKE